MRSRPTPPGRERALRPRRFLGTAAGRLGVALLLCAATLATGHPSPGEAATPTPAVAYLHGLETARADLPGNPAAARAAVVAAGALVADAGGLQPVLAALDAGRVADAATLLDNDIGALMLADAAQPGDPAAATSRLGDVYAQPPLDQLDAPRSDGIAARLQRALGDLVGRAVGGHDATALVVSAAVLALLAALAVRALRGLGAAGLRPPRSRPRGHAGADPDAEWAAALAAAARGDHREAVRRAFRSALLDVAVRGRLAVDPAWTTTELLTATRADADLLAVLAPAAAAFDIAWYSRAPVSVEAWVVERDRCGAIRALARGETARPRPVP